jgi:hypothetical protein
MQDHDWDQFVQLMDKLPIHEGAGLNDLAGNFAEAFAEHFPEGCFHNRNEAEIVAFLKRNVHWRKIDSQRKDSRIAKEIAAFQRIPTDEKHRRVLQHPLEDQGYREPIDLLIEAEEKYLIEKSGLASKLADLDELPISNEAKRSKKYRLVETYKKILNP